MKIAITRKVKNVGNKTINIANLSIKPGDVAFINERLFLRKVSYITRLIKLGFLADISTEDVKANSEGKTEAGSVGNSNAQDDANQEVAGEQEEEKQEHGAAEENDAASDGQGEVGDQGDGAQEQENTGEQASEKQEEAEQSKTKARRTRIKKRANGDKE